MPWLISAMVTVVVSCSAEDADAATAESVTFHRDIAPMVHRRCASCHHDGGAAPFPLIEYDDIARRAQQSLQVIDDQIMPPWLPDSTSPPYRGDRRLTQPEKELWQRWVDAGTPAGDPADAPPQPRFESDWILGTPDVIARMPEPYVLAADGWDVFRNFVLPVEIDQTRRVAGVEIRPITRSVVHHAVMLIDDTGAARFYDQRDDEVGFEEMQGAGAKPIQGHIVGWTPGHIPVMLEPGLSWEIEPGSDLILQLHLVPSGKVEQVEVEIGLYFTDEPATRRPTLLRLGPKTIDIQPGDAGYVIQDSYTTPVDVELRTVYPHAHYLCTTMTGHARFPDGTMRTLIHIPSWDFNWQQEYQLHEPTLLPAGTELLMEFAYDNSAANIRNPNSPPQRVVYGPRTTHEMGDLWLQVIPVDDADYESLTSDFGGKEHRSQLAWYREAATKRPDDPGVHYNLALALSLGQELEAATASFERVLELEPDWASAHSNLAGVYGIRGMLDKAGHHFQRASQLDPDNADAIAGYGQVLSTLGDLAGAVEQFERAVAIDPYEMRARSKLLQTLCGLGERETSAGELARAQLRFDRVLELVPGHVRGLTGAGVIAEHRGQYGKAIGMYRRALKQRPDPTAGRRLAWLLATCPEAKFRNPRQALVFARNVDQRFPAVGNAERAEILDTLAAAYAATGKFPLSVQSATDAAAKAREAQLPQLAQAIEQRLSGYRQQRPYLSPGK